MIAALAGMALITIELLRSFPAAARVRKTRSADGVSGTSLGVLAGTALPWMAMSLLVQGWWVLAANIAWICLHAWLCFEVSCASPGAGRLIAWTATVSTVLFAAAAAGISAIMPITDALGIVLGASTLFYAVPAAYAGLISATTAGLSAVALSVNTLEGAIYVLAGIGLLPLAGGATITGFWIFGCIAVASSGARLIRVSYRRLKGLDLVLAA